MKIPKNLKPESVLSDPQSRQMAAPYLEITQHGPRGTKKGHIVAASSCHLVCLPVELDECDTPGYIPVGALEAARKLGGGKEPAVLLAMDRIVHRDLRTEVRSVASVDKQIPWPRRWRETLMPDAREHSRIVSFELEFLREIAAALGTTRLTLRIKDSKSPIIVHASNVEWDRLQAHAGAILMPFKRETKAEAAKRMLAEGRKPATSACDASSTPPSLGAAQQVSAATPPMPTGEAEGAPDKPAGSIADETVPGDAAAVLRVVEEIRREVVTEQDAPVSPAQGNAANDQESPNNLQDPTRAA